MAETEFDKVFERELDRRRVVEGIFASIQNYLANISWEEPGPDRCDQGTGMSDSELGLKNSASQTTPRKTKNSETSTFVKTTSKGVNVDIQEKIKPKKMAESSTQADFEPTFLETNENELSAVSQPAPKAAKKRAPKKKQEDAPEQPKKTKSAKKSSLIESEVPAIENSSRDSLDHAFDVVETDKSTQRTSLKPIEMDMIVNLVEAVEITATVETEEPKEAEKPAKKKRKATSTKKKIQYLENSSDSDNQAAPKKKEKQTSLALSEATVDDSEQENDSIPEKPVAPSMTDKKKKKSVKKHMAETKDTEQSQEKENKTEKPTKTDKVISRKRKSIELDVAPEISNDLVVEKEHPLKPMTSSSSSLLSRMGIFKSGAKISQSKRQKLISKKPLGLETISNLLEDN